jgi:hypothetical protein
MPSPGAGKMTVKEFATKWIKPETTVYGPAAKLAFEKDLDALLRRERAETLKLAARRIEEKALIYSEAVFGIPPKGKHGVTVDSCSASAIRHFVPGLASEIRELAASIETGGKP